MKPQRQAQQKRSEKKGLAYDSSLYRAFISFIRDEEWPEKKFPKELSGEVLANMAQRLYSHYTRGNVQSLVTFYRDYRDDILSDYISVKEKRSTLDSLIAPETRRINAYGPGRDPPMADQRNIQVAAVDDQQQGPSGLCRPLASKKGQQQQLQSSDSDEDSDDPDPDQRRAVRFDAVTVYSFPRVQGFTCVPSQGGCTLGMSARHNKKEEHTILDASSDEGSPLQPVPIEQRRALLEAAGVESIDSEEEEDCENIRASREHCGCACGQSCVAKICPCDIAKIKCQVEEDEFLCSCTKKGCGNTVGRVAFNAAAWKKCIVKKLQRLNLGKE